MRWTESSGRHLLWQDGKILAAMLSPNASGNEKDVPYFYLSQGGIRWVYELKGKPLEEVKLMLEAFVALEYGE